LRKSFEVGTVHRAEPNYGVAMSERGLRRWRAAVKRRAVAAVLEPGRDVELELRDGTRVGGLIVDLDERLIVLEGSDRQRAPIRRAEVWEAVLLSTPTN